VACERVKPAYIIISIIIIIVVVIDLFFFVVLSQKLESTQWKSPSCVKPVSFSMQLAHDDANQRLKALYPPDEKILNPFSFFITVYTGLRRGARWRSG